MSKLSTVIAAVVCAVGAGTTNAEIVSYLAEGTVESFFGDTTQLPIASAPGDTFRIDFSFDTNTPDTFPDFTGMGLYSVLSFNVTVGSTTQSFMEGARIQIQSTPGAESLWGVEGCLISCSVDNSDHARLNFFHAPGTFTSDALTLPVTQGATVIQFGLYSFTNRQLSAMTANLKSFSATTSVPEPATLALFGLGLAGIGLVRRRPRK